MERELIEESWLERWRKPWNNQFEKRAREEEGIEDEPE